MSENMKSMLTDFHKWQKKNGFNYEGSQKDDLKIKLYIIYLSSILGKTWQDTKEQSLFSHWGPNKNK
jgi:hypothetical protein